MKTSYILFDPSWEMVLFVAYNMFYFIFVIKSTLYSSSMKCKTVLLFMLFTVYFIALSALGDI